jgi:hypothetical protein
MAIKQMQVQYSIYVVTAITKNVGGGLICAADALSANIQTNISKKFEYNTEHCRPLWSIVQYTQKLIVR